MLIGLVLRLIENKLVATGGNLVTWRSKKQNVVARSSAEAEYRAMAHTAWHPSWLNSRIRAFMPF